MFDLCLAPVPSPACHFRFTLTCLAHGTLSTPLSYTPGNRAGVGTTTRSHSTGRHGSSATTLIFPTGPPRRTTARLWSGWHPTLAACKTMAPPASSTAHLRCCSTNAVQDLALVPSSTGATHPPAPPMVRRERLEPADQVRSVAHGASAALVQGALLPDTAVDSRGDGDIERGVATHVPACGMVCHPRSRPAHHHRRRRHRRRRHISTSASSPRDDTPNQEAGSPCEAGEGCNPGCVRYTRASE